MPLILSAAAALLLLSLTANASESICVKVAKDGTPALTDKAMACKKAQECVVTQLTKCPPTKGGAVGAMSMACMAEWAMANTKPTQSGSGCPKDGQGLGLEKYEVDCVKGQCVASVAKEEPSKNN